MLYLPFPIDIFFGIGEGRVYVEAGRSNTEDEGKRKVLDDDVKAIPLAKRVY